MIRMIVQQEPSLSPVQDQPEDLSVKKVGPVIIIHPKKIYLGQEGGKRVEIWMTRIAPKVKNMINIYKGVKRSGPLYYIKTKVNSPNVPYDYRTLFNKFNTQIYNTQILKYNTQEREEGEGSSRPSSASPHTRSYPHPNHRHHHHHHHPQQHHHHHYINQVVFKRVS